MYFPMYFPLCNHPLRINQSLHEIVSESQWLISKLHERIPAASCNS